MKIIIAAAASLTFATSAIAAVSHADVVVPQADVVVPKAEKKTVLKTEHQVELAWGPNRSNGVSSSNKGAPGGKEFNGR
ncbi:hypothetical protein [Ensifer sp. B1-9]|uniref:hypothetical protein n=1 Tax=Ensifer sp. B1-9 TaxID=3141455 RepID=UPI003D26087E